MTAAFTISPSAALHAQWTQTWGGNFADAAGTSYNQANWWNDVQSSPVWDDGTQQTTLDSTNNVYVDGNGDLVLAMTYFPGATHPYTSARLTSKQALGPYGRFYTRIQNPAAQGTATAQYNNTVFGPNVYVFDPNIAGSTINATINSISNRSVDQAQFATSSAGCCSSPAATRA